MRIHKETLNRHKLNLLQQGADEVNRTGNNIVDIKLFADNINSYNNWQKLRYHGLIAHVTENGIKQRGKWLITNNGWAFLRGDISLPKFIMIGENHIVEKSNEQLDARDLYRESEIVESTFEYYEPTYRPVPMTLELAWES